MNIQHSQIKSSLYDLTEKVYREKKSGHTALNLLCINTLLLNINMFTEFVIASLNEIKAK